MAVPHQAPSWLAETYSVPVTSWQVPGSSPVTFSERPTSLPVTRLPWLVAETRTLAGWVPKGAVWQKVLKISAPRYSVPVTVRQVPASLPVVARERLAWVPVTVWPWLVSVRPTFQLASAAAAKRAPLRLGPLGRQPPPLRAVPAEPTLLLSSRTFWASSRLERSGLAWRATAAAVVLVAVVAALPLFDRDSRRARTRARLGLYWAERLTVARRSAAALAAALVPALPLRPAWLRLRAALLLNEREGSAAFASTGGAEAATVAGAGCWRATSLRVRSRELSARLPRRERASRRASTKSRLGLGIARVGLRRDSPDRLDRSGAGREAADLAALALAGAAATATGAGLAGAGVAGAAGSGSVRVARASAAVRTRTGAELKRPSAFLPPLVSALRRSRAASRLVVLAMSARKMKEITKS